LAFAFGVRCVKCDFVWVVIFVVGDVDLTSQPVCFLLLLLGRIGDTVGLGCGILGGDGEGDFLLGNFLGGGEVGDEIGAAGGDRFLGGESGGISNGGV
jgi:hypothetical protein